MKFVLLKSRGGDYRVVAANIAYLRADENGQTKIGLVGGDALLVVGSMDEVEALIAADSLQDDVAATGPNGSTLPPS